MSKVKTQKKGIKKYLVTSITTFAVLIGTVAAWAIYQATLGVNGDLKSAAQFQPKWQSATGSGSCTATLTSGKITIKPTDDGMYPGDSCKVSGTVLNLQSGATAPSDAVVAGINVTGLPTGWTASLNGAACGTHIKAGATSSTITITITMGEDAPVDGKTVRLGDDTGLLLQPSSQGSVTSCPDVVGSSN